MRHVKKVKTVKKWREFFTLEELLQQEENHPAENLLYWVIKSLDLKMHVC